MVPRALFLLLFLLLFLSSLDLVLCHSLLFFFFLQKGVYPLCLRCEKWEKGECARGCGITLNAYHLSHPFFLFISFPILFPNSFHPLSLRTCLRTSLQGEKGGWALEKWPQTWLGQSIYFRFIEFDSIPSVLLSSYSIFFEHDPILFSHTFSIRRLCSLFLDDWHWGYWGNLSWLHI